MIKVWSLFLLGEPFLTKHFLITFLREKLNESFKVLTNKEKVSKSYYGTGKH